MTSQHLGSHPRAGLLSLWPCTGSPLWGCRPRPLLPGQQHLHCSVGEQKGQVDKSSLT